MPNTTETIELNGRGRGVSEIGADWLRVDDSAPAIYGLKESKPTGTAAAEICAPSAEPGDQCDILELTSDSSLYIAVKSAHCIDSVGRGNLPDKVRQHQIYRHLHPQPSLVNPS